MPRAKQRTPELRDRVLRVALDTLAAEGVAGFTTRRVAGEAGTSTPAVYELFGDKAGLVREVFFEGFRMLQRHFDEVTPTEDARADLLAVALSFRRFVHDHPVLADVMFARPFSDFDPGPDERQAGAAVRRTVVGYVRRAIDAGVLAGDEVDIAHALVALTQGLAAAESSRRLGTSPASVDRRWSLAVGALLDGLAP
jgi:AcrR family transcriptional regulator